MATLIAALGPRDLSSPLSRADKLRLSGEVLGTYCGVRWWLWRREFPDVVTRLRRPGAFEAGEPFGDAGSAHVAGLRLGRAVSRTLRLLPTDSRCLVQSLVLTRMLGRRRLNSSLVIAARSEPDFAAHAWVEHAGEPLLPPGDAGFQRLVET